MSKDSGREKASFFLDDDEDAGILDGLEGHDVPEKKKEPSRTMPSQSPSKSMDRVDYYRGLQGFIQAMSEATPLFLGELDRNPGSTPDEIRRKVASACKEHLDIVANCLDMNNLDSNDLMLRYQRRSLAKNVAQLYKIAPMSAVRGIVSAAKDWQMESKDFDNSSTESISTDAMLNAKMALFSATMRSRLTLEGLWCSLDPAEVIIHLQKTAIDLARQVAFNWSKRAHISDQDNLFISSLPHCLLLAESAYRDQVVSALPPIGYIPADPEMGLPYLEEAIADMDMGFEGESKATLLNRVRSIVADYFSDRPFPDLPPVHRSRLISAYTERLDEAFASAWEEAAQNLISKIEEMSPEEREAYAAENDRMDLSGFFMNIEFLLERPISPLDDIEIDFDQVSQEARHNLAWLWGISDSLIASRKETLGDLHL